MKNPGQMAQTARKLNGFLEVETDLDTSRSTQVSSRENIQENYSQSLEGEDINEEL